MPPPGVPALPVNWLTVKPHDECECQELQKMYATWSHQLTGWIWTGRRCQQYKREWGVPWPMQPRDYTASPLGVKRKYLPAWGVQCSGTEYHMPSTITCPLLDMDDYSWRLLEAGAWAILLAQSAFMSIISLIYVWYVLLFQCPRDLISQSLRPAGVAVVAPPICKLCPL